MARAETIESVAETGGGGNGPLSHPNTCRMELPRPLHAWSGLLATTAIATNPGTPSAAVQLQHNGLRPLQALCMSYPLPRPHPRGRDEPRTHQDFPALSPSSTPPPSPLCSRRAAPGDVARDQSDSDGPRRRHASGRHPPPADQHPSGAQLRRGAAADEAAPELDVRRVAHQLRTIGDAFNATAHRRAHVAPQWPGFRDACRGLLNFVTQTLSTLYRLT